jgi:hypothetical protein
VCVCMCVCACVPLRRDVDHVVRNTIINKAGAEFSGAAGINVGYTQRVLIHGNDVSNMSYIVCSSLVVLACVLASSDFLSKN